MSSITDPYDGLDLPAVQFKPETPGETIEIRVTEIKPVQTKDGGKTGALVAGVDDDGVTHEWVAWNFHNKAELARERPLPGDQLRITYDGRDPDASNPALAARWFTLKKLSPPGGGGQSDEIPFRPSVDGVS